MFKVGIAFLFGAFTHLFLAMIWAEYYELAEAKITNSFITHHLDSFYTLFYWELAISAVIILLSFFIKKEPK
ncbi:hypothetical protein [Brevibacillus laterosporus]|uniref:hypothetical protein n=1 Tax=Brevibacillus laterosporus TaxID=1465 RepID=UPI000379CBA6|nr:hypothetical protein [Brevibacillus laterosporus]ATO49384.1 hypothetical protein BrL25_09830 [Brevibacillus laterosporus DSM 25]MBG9800737.1 hypothetical protein [Brevibacillus laterosporus]MED1787910.1 hypothetical protein [Brevibacillus laterosporus]MED2004538.1 hypothetical protein [Brevibacillus laterosporus]MED4762279.1 hypothetical protein [Brevibacillus laterosporus]